MQLADGIGLDLFRAGRQVFKRGQSGFPPGDRSGPLRRHRQNLTKEISGWKKTARQTIRYFSRESDLPLILGLLVDTSRSMQTVFEPERVASTRFLDQMLRPDRDLAAVVHFDVKVGVLQDFTASREKLAAALEQLKIPPRPATLLYDAVAQASEKLMRKQLGRKAFILLSDGMDFRSKTSLSTAIESAQRADTMIYSILFANYRNPTSKRAKTMLKRGRKVMTQLATETGGGFFEVSGAIQSRKSTLRSKTNCGISTALVTRRIGSLPAAVSEAETDDG